MGDAVDVLTCDAAKRNCYADVAPSYYGYCCETCNNHVDLLLPYGPYALRSLYLCLVESGDILLVWISLLIDKFMYHSNSELSPFFFKSCLLFRDLS